VKEGYSKVFEKLSRIARLGATVNDRADTRPGNRGPLTRENTTANRQVIDNPGQIRSFSIRKLQHYFAQGC
jgi:hypothetical protein